MCKKTFVLMTLLLVVSLTTVASGAADKALFVVGSVSLNSGDTAVKSQLETLGYTVTVVDDSASTTSDADGNDLVVISSTITSGNVNTKFRDVTVPVINWEEGLHDDMKMVPSSGSVHGKQLDQTQIAITDANHAMAGGLSGTVTVYSSSDSITWGKPNRNADAVATLTGDSTKKVVFGYESGAEMEDSLTAPVFSWFVIIAFWSKSASFFS